MLTAHDVMTRDIVTVPPETSAIAMARLLAERGISAVPVVGAEGQPLGVVTEADLIRRLAGAEDKPTTWFRTIFADPAADATRFARTHGQTAADVMTEELVTVAEDETVTRIAQLMEERGIRRVLVVADGRLRGIVSRADLLRALVAPARGSAEALSDERIRRDVLAAMRQQPWADAFYTLVDVKDGVVEFHGFLRDAAVRRGLRVLAETVPGVKGVLDNTRDLPTYVPIGA